MTDDFHSEASAANSNIIVRNELRTICFWFRLHRVVFFASSPAPPSIEMTAVKECSNSPTALDDSDDIESTVGAETDMLV